MGCGAQSPAPNHQWQFWASPRLVDTRSSGWCRLSASILELDGEIISIAEWRLRPLRMRSIQVTDGDHGRCWRRPQVTGSYPRRFRWRPAIIVHC
jgi:hypothetical protein